MAAAAARLERAQINNKGMCELSGAHMVEEIVMLKTRVTAAAAADPPE